MRKSIFMIIIAAALLLIAVLAGCDKERIVESTEYIETTEYVQLPPDTVTIVDTVFSSDSVNVHTTDTITVTHTDTVYQTNYVHDTVFNTQYVYDTITTTQYVYDTVVQTSFAPNEFTAFGALQYYTDPMVFEFINSEFGLSDGYIFYISAFQMETTKQSSNVYDIYGYIDYWTTDWSGYYALEFYWRMTYLGGDPANPNNWQIAEPPSGASNQTGGIQLKEKNITDIIR